MTTKGTVYIQDLVGLLNRLYPSELAEDWDNVGLQVGDPGQEVQRAMVSLDPGFETVETAIESGCQALIAHHPLIFNPLKKVVPSGETGRTLFKAIQNGLAVIIAHTNLDRARGGLNDWLALRLGLVNVKPLEKKSGELLKLVVFVPAEFEEKLADALFDAGAGHVGEYDQCSFLAPGRGTFRPGPGTSPFIGEAGKREKVDEVRLETIIPSESKNRIVRKLLQVHPYEEVAYDLIPLENSREDLGLGRIGYLQEKTTLKVFAERTKELLEAPVLRVVGDMDRTIEKVAVCGGSGASLFGEAVKQGADLFITGDLKYHEARSAESQNMAVFDAGHFHTEKWMVPSLASRLRTESEKLGHEITFLEMNQEKDPFRTF